MTSLLSPLRRAIDADKPALIALLREHADWHASFARSTEDTAARCAAQDLSSACEEIVHLIEANDLIAILREVRMQVPALHAARQVLEAHFAQVPD